NKTPLRRHSPSERAAISSTLIVMLLEPGTSTSQLTGDSSFLTLYCDIFYCTMPFFLVLFPVSVINIIIRSVVSHIFICRTDNLTGVHKLLKAVCAPARYSRYSKNRSEKLFRNTQHRIYKTA